MASIEGRREWPAFLGQSTTFSLLWGTDVDAEPSPGMAPKRAYRPFASRLSYACASSVLGNSMAK
jgi:hypothetical protein